jgi:hypothetical protein
MTTNLYASYFSQWAKCDTAKRILSAAVETGAYLYPDAALMPTGAVITTSGLLTRIGAPANWWTNTPRFNLAMETNGWRFIPAAMSNVVWAKANGWGHTNDVYAYSVGYSDVSYDDAYADANTYYPDAVLTNSFYEPQSVALMYGPAYLGASQYGAQLERHHGDIFAVLSGNSIQFEASCSLYLKTTTNTLFGPTESYYDAQGDSVSQAYTNLLSWVNAAGAITSAPVRIGDYPMTTSLASRTNPTDDYIANTGWQIDDLCTVLKYIGPTNGFKWFP